jgi:hypothetical protein
MTVQGLAVDDFVPISVTVAPPAVPYSNIGVPLMIGDSKIIDVNERVRQYTSLTGVATDFGNTAPEYLACVPYFGQEPQPELVYIGRWASTSTSAELEGAYLTTEQQLLTNFTGITSGGFYIEVDGFGYAITGLNFSTATNLNGVAAEVQTQLMTVVGDVGCVWNASYGQFIVTVAGVSGPTSTIGYANVPTAVGLITLTGQPTATHTISLGGTAVEFVAGTPTGDQVKIGTTDVLTTAALLTFLNASADVNISQANYLASGGLSISVVYNTPGAGGDAFTLTTTDSNITLSGATLAGGNATDVSALLGLSLIAGATPPVNGIAAETLLSATEACANASSQWYDEILAAAATPTQTDLINTANYILASEPLRTFGLSTQDTGVLNPEDTSDIASVMQSLNNKRVFVNYSSTNPYSVASLAGRIGTVDYLASLTTITLAWKQAPGIIAENLNQNEFATLVSKGCNAVILVQNGAQMIWPGQMENGYWIDEVFGCDWLANYVQTNMFNFMYSDVTTKVPQTDAGDNMLATNIENSLVQGVVNGLMAPGVWDASPFGSLNTGYTLSNGFYVWYPLIATQSETERDERISVPFQCAVKLAGAVHQPNILISVNR